MISVKLSYTRSELVSQPSLNGLFIRTTFFPCGLLSTIDLFAVITASHLSHTSFKRHLQQFLRLYGKLHG